MEAKSLLFTSIQLKHLKISRNFKLIVMIVSLLPILLSSSMLQAVASVTDNISNTGRASQPQIAVSGNNVYVVWSDSSSGNGDIYFRVSHNNGATFSDTKKIVENPELSTDPQIAVSGNNVYVVWLDLSANNQEIFFKASHDNGQNFDSQIINLSNEPASSLQHQVTAVENNVYVVWSDSRSGNGDIYMRVSRNNGLTFEDQFIQISNDRPISDSPRLSAVGNNVYVVWANFIGNHEGDGSLLFRSSDNNAVTFNNNVIIDSIRAPSGVEVNMIADASNNIYILWKDDSLVNPPIRFRVSHDNGASFGQVVPIVPFSLASNSELGASENHVYVVWRDSDFSNPGISFRASNDNGDTFLDPRRINGNVPPDGPPRSTPKLSVLGNDVYAIWVGGSPNNVFLSLGHDNGAIFEDPLNLSTNEISSVSFSSPEIISSGSNVYAVWVRSVNPQDNDIFFWRTSPTTPEVNCGDLTLKTGQWNINANGFVGDLDIMLINDQGILDGSLTMRNEPTHHVIGFWDNISKKITFMRIINPDDPSSIQVYTGYLFCNDMNGLNAFYSLAGSFEAFTGSGGSAQRSIYGWYAILSGAN